MLRRKALRSHRVRMAGGRIQLVIRGLDAVASEAEVLEAAREVAGEDSDIEIAGMWMTFGDTRATRATAEKETAVKLMEARLIRVGPIWAKVRSPEQERCFRCWGERYKGSNCKG